MTSTAATRRGWRLRAVLVAGIVALLALQPIAVGAQERADVPDGWEDDAQEIRPPAPGEGDYVDPALRPDEAGGDRANQYPTARYALDGQGTTFAPQTIEVLSGSNRYLTSVATAQQGWPDGADAVVLATGQDYHDPLAAAGLAGTVGGPLLLTADDYLEPGVGDELERLDPDVVYVVGRLSGQVEGEVTERGLDVERVSVDGDDPHTTAMRITEEIVDLGGSASTVLVASARDYADALSASALAAGQGTPILFAPTDADAKERFLTFLADQGVEETWIVGGGEAIPGDDVEGAPGLERLAGRERTETAAVVADRALDLGMTGRPVVARSDGFADSLTGGVLAGGALDGPVLLTPRQELFAAPAAWLADAGHSRLEVAGGQEAISQLTRCQLQDGDTRSFRCVEEQLHHQRYHVGAVNGRLDETTIGAFFAFQKVAGLTPDGVFGSESWRAMIAAPTIAPQRGDLTGDRVEVNIARQLILVVRGGEVEKIFHTSTGKASTPTIRGVFNVYEKRNVRQSHNAMYRPVFFIRGYAFHGYPEVPLQPASDGCMRMFDNDMDVMWDYLPMGHTVATY